MLEDRLLARATRDEAWTPARLSDGRVAARYGLGWALGRGTVQHSGAQQGCSAALVLEPERRRVIAVLVNTSDVDASGLADELRALVAGE